MDDQKSLFYEKLSEYYLANQDAKKPWNCEEMKEVAKDILLGKHSSGKKTRRQYHLLSLYDTMELEDEQIVIIKKRLEESDDIIYITPYEDLFEILYSTHIAVGHGSRDKMIFALKSKYQIPRPVVETFLQSCQVCHKKKAKKHVNLVTRPIVSKEFCSRGQVDLIDYQSCQDGDYKWLLNYQDHFTKFISLRPLKSKQSVEVAAELLKIFLEFGAPTILQSDNDREFVNSVITELVKLWPDLKIIHGGPQHPQSQGSIERCNQDVENMLRAWMFDKNSTNWSVGCYFVQFQKNCSHHRIIGHSPYRALFGVNPKIGLSSTNLPSEIIKTETEEDFNNESLAKLHRGEGAEKDNEIVNVSNNSADELNRNECHSGQKRAAEEMLSGTAKKLPKLNIGACVLLSVEKVDCGPSDMQNLICVIVDYKNAVYQLGSSVGKIKGWYNRADIVAAPSQLLNIQDVPDKYISVREAVSGVSLRDGQGYLKCSCKPSKKQCQTNRCVCFKKKVMCNFICHNSATCLNN